MEAKEIFVALGQTLLAAFFGVVRWLNAKDKKRLKAFVLLCDMASAVASGIIVYFFFYRYLAWDVNLCFCLAALFGLMGSGGVRKLENIIFKHTGITVEEGKNDK